MPHLSQGLPHEETPGDAPQCPPWDQAIPMQVLRNEIRFGRKHARPYQANSQGNQARHFTVFKETIENRMIAQSNIFLFKLLCNVKVSRRK